MRWPQKNSRMDHLETNADFARRMGWGPGTVIEGDEGYGMERRTITAIGREKVLAVADVGGERTLDLYWRDWREAPR